MFGLVNALRLWPNRLAGVAAALDMNFLTGSLDPRISFSRASPATRVNEQGFVEQVASNVPRFDYDPVTLEPRGLLIEDGKVNICQHSTNLANPVWSKVDVTLSSVVGVTGTPSAYTLAFGSAGTGVLLQNLSATANTVYAFSFYLKAGNTPWVRAILDDTVGSNQVRAWFNPNTGAAGGAQTSGTSSYVSHSMVPAGNGWYRCTIVGRVDATSTNLRLGLITAPTDLSVARFVGSFSVDALQLEVGEYASSVIFTAGAQGVRSTDSAVMVGSNFSSWYNPVEGSAVVNFSRFGFDSVAGSVGLFQFDNATAAERVALRITPRAKSASPQLTVTVGGVVLLNEGIGNVDISGGSQTYAMSYKVNDSAVGRNGVAQTTTAFLSLPTVTQATLGGGAAASGLNGHIRSIRYYSTRLPNATLAGLTA